MEKLQENPMGKFEGERDEFTLAKTNFFKDFEGSGSLEEKLSSLEATADAIGENEENSRDFEENVLKQVQFKNPELYEAYQSSLKKLAA